MASASDIADILDLAPRPSSSGTKAVLGKILATPPPPAQSPSPARATTLARECQALREAADRVLVGSAASSSAAAGAGASAISAHGGAGVAGAGSALDGPGAPAGSAFLASGLLSSSPSSSSLKEGAGGADGAVGAGLKERRRLRCSRTTADTAWVWAPFRNAARTDGALLWHWARRADVARDGEYEFARFARRQLRFATGFRDAEEYALCFGDASATTTTGSGSGSGSGTNEGSSNNEGNGGGTETGERLMPWTREETELLLRLCERFALRWVVITDRWEQLFAEQALTQRPALHEHTREDAPVPMAVDDGNQQSSSGGDTTSNSKIKSEEGDKEKEKMEEKDKEEEEEEEEDEYGWPLARVQRRTMEELKERFYAVQKRLLQVRATGRGAETCEPPNALASFAYDRRREEARKAAAERLLGRTREQLQEEEDLLEILHRVSAQTRDALPSATATTTATTTTTTPNTPAGAGTGAGRGRRASVRGGRRRRREESVPPAPVATPAAHTAPADDVAPEAGAVQGEVSVADAAAEADAAAAAQLPAIFRQRKHPTRPTMRSHLLLGPQLSKEQTARVQETLARYHVPYVRVPTAASVEAFVALRTKIVHMMEMERLIQKKKYLLNLLQQQYGEGQRNSAAAAAAQRQAFLQQQQQQQQQRK